MSNESLTFSICHLYPDLLNLYGDRGNILTIKKRCEWRGIDVTVHNVGLGQAFEPDLYDLIFLGGGQDFEQSLILRDLVDNKGEAIRSAVESGKVFLCICGGYQMMGDYYLDQTGNKMDCLHAMPIHTIAGPVRLIGNVVARSNELAESGVDPILVGFENHSGRTYLGEGVKPLASIIQGFGNNAEDQYEGARYKNVYCTYMHGSFLPKNPKMADHIIKTAINHRTNEPVHLAHLDDEFAENARTYIQTCKKHK